MKIKKNNDKIDLKNKSIAKPKNKFGSNRTIKTKFKKNNSYFDTSPISKGLIILGIVLLLTYYLYFVVSSNTSQNNIHEDQIRGPGLLDWFVPLSLLLIIVGAIFLFISHQFVKLSEFAQEVDSGEFEKKVLEELDTK